MQQPRQQFYNFAHRVLKQDALEEPKLWSFITGDRADGYAAMRWHDAGEAAGENHPSKGLLWAEPMVERGVEIVLLRTPDPLAPTETYWIGFARTKEQPFPLRYFVCERSTEGGAYWAEWRQTMRIRGQPLEEWPTDAAKRSAMPLPYAATFVEAIAGELVAFPRVADPPPSAGAAAAAAKRAAAKDMPGSNSTKVTLIVLLVGALVIAAFLLAR